MTEVIVDSWEDVEVNILDPENEQVAPLPLSELGLGDRATVQLKAGDETFEVVLAAQ